MTIGLKSNADGSGAVQINSSDAISIGTDLVVSGTKGGLQVVTALTTPVTASGSSVDFTNIPAWVKRITVEINQLSYAAAGGGTVQIGSGSLTTSGYNVISVGLGSTPAISLVSTTNGFGVLTTSAASTTITGTWVITNMGGNTWVCSEQHNRAGDTLYNLSTGSLTLTGTLDRLSIVATTSTFDAGTVNILYE